VVAARSTGTDRALQFVFASQGHQRCTEGLAKQKRCKSEMNEKKSRTKREEEKKSRKKSARKDTFRINRSSCLTEERFCPLTNTASTK
jgi:hypothetical protein